MVAADLPEHVGVHRADALAVNLDIGDRIAFVRRDGEGLVFAFPDVDIAGGGDCSAFAGGRFDGVAGVFAAVASGGNGFRLRILALDNYALFHHFGLRSDFA